MDLSFIRRSPATWTLAAGLVAVFAFQLWSDGRGYDYMTGAGRLPDVITTWGVWSPAVRRGELIRLLTAGFLHASVIHIALNLWGLFYAGPFVERWFGSVRFAAIFLVAVVVGDALASATADPRTVTIGASGGIVGLFAAVMVVGWRFWSQRDEIARGAVPLVATLANGFLHPSISNAAHIGGAIGGGIAAIAVGFSEAERSRIEELQERAVARDAADTSTSYRPSSAETSDPANTLVLRTTSRRRVVFAAIGIGLLALAVPALLEQPGDVMTKVFGVLLGVLGLAMFPSVFRAALVLTPQGIEVRGFVTTRIPWAEIQPPFIIQAMSGTYFVAFRRRATIESRQSGFSGTMTGGTRRVAAIYGLSADDQARLIAEWYQRWTRRPEAQ